MPGIGRAQQRADLRAEALVVLQRRADAAQAEALAMAAGARAATQRSSPASNVRIVTGSGRIAASSAR